MNNTSCVQSRTGLAGCCLFDIALLTNRLSLGMFFLLAGVAKFRMGVGEFYDKFFLPLKPPWLPDFIAWPFGHALPAAEVILGGLLVVGLLSRLVASLTAALLIAITIALWQKGMFFNGAGPFHTNVVFLTLAFLLAVSGAGRYSLDRLLRRGKRDRYNEPLPADT